MNIFYLNKDLKIAAMEHKDKHCVKMILEYAQMLSKLTESSMEKKNDKNNYR